MSEAPPVESLAAFAKARGLVTMAEARGHIHAGLRCAPPTKRFRRWYEAETRRLLAEADQTARAYGAARGGQHHGTAARHPRADRGGPPQSCIDPCGPPRHRKTARAQQCREDGS